MRVSPLLFVCALLCAALFCAGAAHALPAPSNLGYYRYPAIHGHTIVFTSEGDLWKVDSHGGNAQSLTSHPGEESHAAISPDGTTVAFSASYEGPWDVYVMPLAGGLPTRLTYDPFGATVVGWTPDGRVMYTTGAQSTLPDHQLMTVDPKTLARAVVPLSQAGEGVYDPTGRTLYFTRQAFQGSHTRRYQGGTAQNLWKYVSGAAEAAPLTASYAGTSKSPLWWQGRIYFVSDRNGTMNLWRMAPDGGDLHQLTHHVGLDVQSPSLDDGHIVYQCGADLYLYDIAAGQDHPIPITLSSDMDQTREKWITHPMDSLSSADISPDAKRVVLTSRGRVFVAPARQGRLVEVTRKPGVRYRAAQFDPDGKSLLVLSDESGETEWWRFPANGVGEPHRLTYGARALRQSGQVSPDGHWIAFGDKNQALWVYNVVQDRMVRVGASDYSEFYDLRWSPDSRWLAYVASTSTFDRITLYDTLTARSVPITTARADSRSPAWSPDGKWLYFLSDRTFRSTVGSPWGPRQPEPFFDHQTRIYQLALTPGLRSPFQPDDELHPDDDKPAEPKPDIPKPDPAKPAPAKPDAPKPDAAKPDAAKPDVAKPDVPKPDDAKKTPPAVPPVQIVLDGLAGRVRVLPVPAGDYGDLRVNGGRLFWVRNESAPGATPSLMSLDIGHDKITPKALMDDIQGYGLTPDGKNLLLQKGGDLYVLSAAGGLSLDDAKVDLSAWGFSLTPREEWRQMLVEAWRLERDYFYDRNMNGVDWPATLQRYLPLCDRVRDREELNDLLGQMISDLSALHMFVYGGDIRQGPDQISAGSLGAALVRDEAHGGFWVARLYHGDPDDPEHQSPLAMPGVEVAEGDVITAINGVDTLSVPDPAVLLRRQAGQQVLLHVWEKATHRLRDVIATPIGAGRERDLQYTDWEVSRRQKTETASDGTIGYVHLRAMGSDDIAQWARDFYPVFDRAGLIIDVRHNQGGNIDSWLLEKLMRKAWFYWQPRVGAPTWNMQWAFRGHVVVLCDEWTASDGEAFAEGFRRLGLGKVIGARTWGGEIWLSSDNGLVDNGIATAAETGVYGAESKWLIEGHGVDPDIVVDNRPHATFEGQDAQLDAAIAYLQREIKLHPVPVPPAPAYPDKSGRPRPPAIIQGN